MYSTPKYNPTLSYWRQIRNRFCFFIFELAALKTVTAWFENRNWAFAIGMDYNLILAHIKEKNVIKNSWNAPVMKLFNKENVAGKWLKTHSKYQPEVKISFKRSNRHSLINLSDWMVTILLEYI